MVVRSFLVIMRLLGLGLSCMLESSTVVTLIYMWTMMSHQTSLALQVNMIALTSSAPIDVLVFPRNPFRVIEVDQIIHRSIIDSDNISTIRTDHRHEYSGIECWRLKINEAQLEALHTQFIDGDVSHPYRPRRTSGEFIGLIRSRS